MAKRIFLISTIIIFLVSPGQFSKAAEPAQGLTISPPLKELELQASQTVREIIKITNPTPNIIEVYPLAMNFQAQGEEGQPAFSLPQAEEKYTLASWIRLPQSKIALTSQQVVEFAYEIVVPEKPEPGGHYGVVFFANQPAKPGDETSQIALGNMVGSLILVRIPGEISEKALLKEFSTSQKSYFKPPVDFRVRIANQGNVHFKPQGEITLKNWRGLKVGELVVNEQKGNVLPESIRKFTLTWPANQWTAGRFRAKLHLVYGENDQVLESELVFWLVPYWAIAVLAILLIAITIVIIAKIKRRRRRKAPPPPQPKKIILR